MGAVWPGDTDDINRAALGFKRDDTRLFDDRKTADGELAKEVKRVGFAKTCRVVMVSDNNNDGDIGAKEFEKAVEQESLLRGGWEGGFVRIAAEEKKINILRDSSIYAAVECPFEIE